MANSSHDLSDRAVLGSLALLLSAVRRVAADTPVLLIGAAARDLLLVHAHGVEVQRATEDTDLALAVRNWEAFLRLRGALITSGSFTADRSPHRLWFGDQRVDIIPFGGVERPDRTIAWPTGGAEVMSVAGLTEALATAVVFRLPGGVSIDVAPLPALALLKIWAWMDRRFDTEARDRSRRCPAARRSDASRGSRPTTVAPDGLLRWSPRDQSFGGLIQNAPCACAALGGPVTARSKADHSGGEAVSALRARPPCRLHFLLAREAPTGVLFRRGPSRWVRLIKWNVADDTFELGQWFKGRIYEKRCDLSPDGSKLIYFAQKMNHRTLNDAEYSYAWTAISRPPYLTAVALWRKGDCWNGGGLFETNSRVWLNHYPGGSAHPDHQPTGLDVVDQIDQRGEDDTVLDRRLSRDGWKLCQRWQGRFHESPFARAQRDLMAKGLSFDEMLAESLRLKLYELDTDSRYITDSPEVRERSSPDGRFFLGMEMTIRGFTAVYAFAVGAAGGEKTPLEGAEWADWDQRGRLAFVRRGKVFVAQPGRGQEWQQQELADFNPQEPVPLESPDWARRW